MEKTFLFCMSALMTVGFSVFPSSVYAEVLVYDFSAPRFTLGQITPFFATPPNIGSSTFLADFIANIEEYAIVGDPGWALFSGQHLKSQCFCAQSLLITFNTPVYAVAVDFASIAAGFKLTLTSEVGSTSATYPGLPGGSLYFLSAKPFTWIQLGTGVFAIDNLRLNTDPPTPRQAVVLLMNNVVADASTTLTQGQADALVNKLATAIKSLDSGNTRAASNQLGAFINQLSAFIRAGKLSPEKGQNLIDAAEAIRARIGR